MLDLYSERWDLPLLPDRTPPALLIVSATGDAQLVLPVPKRQPGHYRPEDNRVLQQALSLLNGVATLPPGPAIAWVTAEGLKSAGAVSDSWVARQLFDHATVLLPPPA